MMLIILATLVKRAFDGDYIGANPESGDSFPMMSKIANAYGITYRILNNSLTLRQDLLEILSLKGPIICEMILGG